MKTVYFNGLNRERKNLHYAMSEAEKTNTRLEPYRPGNQIG